MAKKQGPGAPPHRPGPYQLRAAINAVHADAARYEDTDWAQILRLYDHLLAIEPSAVVALNRAVAVDEAVAAYRRAAEMTVPSAERVHLIRQASDLSSG